MCPGLQDPNGLPVTQGSGMESIIGFKTIRLMMDQRLDGFDAIQVHPLLGVRSGLLRVTPTQSSLAEHCIYLERSSHGLLV